MPELPEVETVKQGIEPAMRGKVIVDVQVNRYDLRVPVPSDITKALTGQRVESLQRRGKYILVFTGGPQTVVMHLGMSGRMRAYAPQETVTREKHDHIILTMDDGNAIVFNDPRRFGMVFTVPQDTWESHKAFASMGPEPLGNDFNAPVLGKAVARRLTNIKTTLLDQRIVAGIGNIYACEALYRAGIAPQRAAGDLVSDELEALVQSIKVVLNEAIAAGGSSLKDYRQADGQLGYFQHGFAVYDREGQLCRNSGCEQSSRGVIKRIIQAGRSTFYCPSCQK